MSRHVIPYIIIAIQLIGVIGLNTRIDRLRRENHRLRMANPQSQRYMETRRAFPVTRRRLLRPLPRVYVLPLHRKKRAELAALRRQILLNDVTAGGHVSVLPSSELRRP